MRSTKSHPCNSRPQKDSLIHLLDPNSEPFKLNVIDTGYIVLISPLSSLNPLPFSHQHQFDLLNQQAVFHYHYVLHIPHVWISKPSKTPLPSVPSANPLDACSNDSSRLIMTWHWGSSVKSFEDTNRLVHEYLRNHLFDPAELSDFDAHRETKLINKAISQCLDGWHESDIDIAVPDGQPHPPGGTVAVPKFSVPGLLHRSITELIQSVWSSS